MARKPKNAGGIGHNSEPPTDDDIAALSAHYGQKVRVGRLEVEKAALALKAARTAVNGEFKKLAADLKYTRIEFEDLLAKQDMTEKEFLGGEVRRARRYELGGLPVGAQIDMFEHAADTADDQANAYVDGKRAGARGADRDPPGKIATMFHTDWLRGWDEEQAVLIMRLGRAADIFTARAAAPVDGELAAEDEEPSLDPADIDKAARKLRNTGFMEPTPEERSFASGEAVGELADA